MNTQNDFLDNAVDDGVVTDGAGDLDAEMCSYIQNDTEEMCSSLRNDTCGDGCNAFPQKTRQRNQRKSRVWRG